MEVRQRNNNKETLNKEVPNNLVGEQKIKYEKLRDQLETPIETRINVNFCLLIYWLPGKSLFGLCLSVATAIIATYEP